MVDSVYFSELSKQYASSSIFPLPHESRLAAPGKLMLPLFREQNHPNQLSESSVNHDSHQALGCPFVGGSDGDFEVQVLSVGETHLSVIQWLLLQFEIS
jgi:hypothetical protein